MGSSGLPRLLLWDIDGTMVNCGPQVRPLFAAALADVFGTAGEVYGADFAGRTDPSLVVELMTGAGLPHDEVVPRIPEVRDRYLDRLEAALDRGQMRLLPAVVETLERLAARPDVTLALLTGNWERGARIKLAHFDLNRFFPFGAFGCDAHDRNELPPVALARAMQSTGWKFLPEETLIIGDSLLDVACGQAHDIPVLAVATGRTPAEALERAGAHWVVPDLHAAADLLPAG